MKPAAFSVPLCRHPDFPAPGIAGITVAGIWDDDHLTLHYRIEGDLALLRIPKAHAPLAPEPLWAHTCCEVFGAPAHATGYREYNFSPSGEWMSHTFSAYRQRLPEAGLIGPESLCWQRDEKQLTLTVRLPATVFPARAPLRLALATVLERADGQLAYYALRHPPGPPDFHHPSGFALELFAETPTS
jgi:hypothetical protein